MQVHRPRGMISFTPRPKAAVPLFLAVRVARGGRQWPKAVVS